MKIESKNPIDELIEMMKEGIVYINPNSNLHDIIINTPPTIEIINPSKSIKRLFKKYGKGVKTNASK